MTVSQKGGLLDNVSRETLDRLRMYENLLHKWNPKINLVSRTTLEHSWKRHILDSAQIFNFFDYTTGKWVDIGSGGGFPGMVVAILSAEQAQDLSIELVEVDARKAVFLKTVKRELGLQNVIVHQDRVENITAMNADILSARALAPLTNLFEFARIHLSETGFCLFPKGQNWKKECEIAQERWNFSHIAHKSETDANAVVLEIRDLVHV